MKVSRRDNLDRYYVLQAFGYGIFLHRIHHDETVDIFHSHPWDGWSLIFGGYLEERFREPPRFRWLFNTIRASRFHRVSLPRGPVWSLFVHGRRKNRWAVKHRDGRILDVEPWRGVGGRTAYAPNDIAAVQTKEGALFIKRHNAVASQSEERKAGESDEQWLARLRIIYAYRSMPPMVLTCQGPDYREPLPGEGPYDGDE